MAQLPCMGLYKPCINLPFGDCAMYFDHGVILRTAYIVEIHMINQNVHPLYKCICGSNSRPKSNNHKYQEMQLSHEKKPPAFHYLYWLVNRDPYNGLL